MLVVTAATTATAANRIVAFVLFLIFSNNFIFAVQSFHPTTAPSTCRTKVTTITTAATATRNLGADSNNMDTPQCPHPFTELPGDPSLILVTNMDLGDKKMEIMKGISKAIAEATGKPESYVGVSVTDNASVIFGGSDEPCALGNLYSIGSISMESNGQVQAAVTDLLKVPEDRIYINFFDMPRANVGWSRRTFAG